MALYTTLSSLSQTAASNVADGSTDAPSTIDQQTNLLASFTARVRDGDIATAVGSVASAATLVLDGTAGTVNVTGTTAITAITLAEGSVKRLRFAGALTLTNGANLVLPGAANITTGAGDYAIAVGRASGVVEVTQYTPMTYVPKPAFSAANSGYFKLPNGLIVQWGRVAAGVLGADAGAFPITFPNAVLSGVASIYDNAVAGQMITIQVTLLNTSGMGVTKRYIGTGSSTVNDANQGWSFIVVGY